MTQEEKEFLLSDLSARLPYKVKVQMPDKHGGYTSVIESIDIDGCITDSEGECLEVEKVKPYLFPMSSMTDEQRMELNSLLPVGVYLQINSNNFTFFEINTDIVCCFHIEFWDKFFNWLNKNHFDYRGFIKKDLALDATGLNIY